MHYWNETVRNFFIAMLHMLCRLSKAPQFYLPKAPHPPSAGSVKARPISRKAKQISLASVIIIYSSHGTFHLSILVTVIIWNVLNFIQTVPYEDFANGMQSELTSQLKKHFTHRGEWRHLINFSAYLYLNIFMISVFQYIS